MFVDVVIENKSKYTDVFYTYDAGVLDLKPGDRVLVPFGSREKEGYVFAVKNQVNLTDSIEIKNVISTVDVLSLTPEIVKTAQWMKARYGIKYFDALHCFLPKGKPAKVGKKKTPYKDIVSSYVMPEAFTDEQKTAISTICESIQNERNDIYLIHGVTASGKTEVYMEAISMAVEMGKTAIMLVPEISLTTQMIERFSGRFGKENIAVLHSKLTQRERFDEWQRIRNGEARIVIGARLGVFAPLENIGIIIMDEEHEATYKADMSPKYDTVDVAAKRLMTYSGVLVLGSATPSVVSYERVKRGIYKLITLKERYNKTPLPDVEIVDMRKELREGNTSIFSGKLASEIGLCLNQGRQVILLQNRRGYSNFISCRECGFVMKCPECGISLTYHKSKEKMICHYCGKIYDVPSKCPDCGSKKIKYVGAGTEQVEETTKKYFPDAVLDRLDLDTVQNRTDIDMILGNFAQKKTDILIGTQMVAKGLDFDNVGLVGVVLADTTLNIPDYRSSERTFQLITQVAGRAGRGSKRGKVVVQSYEPDNFAITFAKDNDYEGFFKQETYMREMMDYPPFGDIIMVNFTSNDERIAMDIAERCRRYMIACLGEIDEKYAEGVFAPKDAYNFKGKESYRAYILIKCPNGERNRFVFLIDNFQNKIFEEKIKCNIICDVNPYSTF